LNNANSPINDLDTLKTQVEEDDTVLTMDWLAFAETDCDEKGFIFFFEDNIQYAKQRKNLEQKGVLLYFLYKIP
jgi:hypothetical protein